MFEAILIQLGAFSVNVSISVAQIFLSVLIIFSAVKLYQTRDFSQILSWHGIFFIMMIIAEVISALSGSNPRISLFQILSIWTFLYLFACMILFDGFHLKRVLAAFFAGSILNGISGIYDIHYLNMERAIGYFTHALTYGNAAAVVLVASTGVLFFIRQLPSKLKILTCAAAVFSAYALYISASRGPILSAALTLAVMSVYIYKVKAAAAIALLSLIFAAVLFSNSQIQSALSTDRGVPGTASSIGTRIVLWRTAVMGIKDRPVFGHGKGNFSQYVRDNVSVPLSSMAHAHNSYLHYAFSNGLFGFACLSGFLISLFTYIKKRSKEHPPAKAAIFVFIVFLLEGMTENNFGDSEVVMLTMLLLAVLTAPVRSYKNL